MASNYNQLTPAQTEQLAALAEEMGEALQIIGKILRHGYEEYNPFDTKRTSNRQLLTKELADVEFWIRKIGYEQEIDLIELEDKVLDKQESVAKYLHHNNTRIWRG